MADLDDGAPIPRRGKTAADAAYLQRVGDRVRAARDALGYTRKHLSTLSGVSERYLAELEAGSGNASLIVVRRVASALSIGMDEMLSERPARSPELQTIVAHLGRLSVTDLSKAHRLLLETANAPTDTRPQRIALIGLRGAGKSTIGRAAATSLDVPFIELDREIERAAGMELSEIFALQGKAVYRQHEVKCLQAVIDRHHRVVIATGGSLVTEAATYEMLLSTCFVAWLKAEPQSHMDRVMAQGDVRPMADNPAAMDDLRSILASRQSLYARAHATIDTTASSHAEAVHKLLEAFALAPRAAVRATAP